MSAAPRCFCGQPDGAASHVLASHPQFHAIEAASFAASPPSPPRPPAELPRWRCAVVRSHGVCNTLNEGDDDSCGACGNDKPAAPLRSPACICASWCANIGKVDAPFSLLAARNPDSYHGYDGEVFRFCPWCGTGLTTSATDSLAGASVLTPSVDYLEYQFQLTPEQADMLTPARDALSTLQDAVREAATDAGLIAARLLADAASGDFGRTLDDVADESRALAVRLRSLASEEEPRA